MDTAPLALPPEAAAEPAAAVADDTGFRIGLDHARHALAPPAGLQHDGHAVHAGWRAGQVVFGARCRTATPAVRRWLQWRLLAWQQGSSFDAEALTPALLARIAVRHCPVTGEALTRDTGGTSDAVLVRLHPQAGFALGNVCELSRRAQQARGGHGVRELLALAQRAAAAADDGAPAAAGSAALGATQWERLAVLLSFTTPLPHDSAAALPLVLLPPPRVRVLNPVQALQLVLTWRCTQPAPPGRLDDLARLFPDAVRTAFCVFATTLLARRLAAGATADASALREAMLQAWMQPLVRQRWQRLALQLTPALCERVAQHMLAHGMAGPGLRDLDFAQATEGWGLPAARAQARSAMASTALPRAATPPRRHAARCITPVGAELLHRPGSAAAARPGP